MHGRWSDRPLGCDCVRNFVMDLGNILVWNVRGLNVRLQRSVVWELIGTHRPSLVWLQETKLHVISNFDVIQLIGPGFDYAYPPPPPVDNTRGCILVACQDTVWTVSHRSIHTFSVSIKIKHLLGEHD
jgi:hypothetical protein